MSYWHDVIDWIVGYPIEVAKPEALANTAEVMAHGMPAVSFDCDTGPRGMICHDVDGLPIPLGDVAGLMSARDR